MASTLTFVGNGAVLGHGRCRRLDGALSTSPWAKGGTQSRFRSVHLAAACSRGVRRVQPTTISSAADGLLNVGCVVEYVASSGQKRLGCAIRPDGKKNWFVEDQHGVVQSVAPKQISYVLGSSPTDLVPSAIYESTDEKVSAAALIAAIEAESEARVAEYSELVEIAWEIVVGRDIKDGEPVASLEEIAELVFGASSLANMYASHVLMVQDRTYFKEKIVKGRAFYEAKSEKMVLEAKVRSEAAARKEEEERLTIQLIIDSVSSRDTSKLRSHIDTVAYSTMVRALETIALDYGSAFGEIGYDGNPECGFSSLDEASKSAARQVLKALGKPVAPRSAFDILVAWKVFAVHENISLRRDGLRDRFAFSAHSLEASKELTFSDSIPDLDAENRIDLSRLASYAIDSLDTTEVDDALSWDPGESMVWVHVADPTRYFPDGLEHVLFAEALRRGTTVYLPTEKFTMFPCDLAALKFSLGGPQSDGCALSFGFKVRGDGNLEETSIVVRPSRISPPTRLTYDEVDQVVESQSAAESQTLTDLNSLLTAADLRQRWRTAQGAIVVSTPFSRIFVDDSTSEEPLITIKRERTDTPAWKLVSELMITASGIAGDFGAKNNIPLPYRGQEGFDYPSEEALQDIPEGPARVAAIFKSARASEVSSSPLEHASLALDAYVQITSPIRRSVDLLGHYQLKAALRGDQVPLSSEVMGREINRSLEIGRTVRALDARTSKYWHLEYLRRLGLSSAHDAVYVRPLRDADERLGLVEICETGFQVLAQLPPGSIPGVAVSVRFSAIDPRNLSSRAEAVLQSPAKQTGEILGLEEDFFEDILSDVSDDGGPN
jgi:exoribonuclease II